MTEYIEAIKEKIHWTRNEAEGLAEDAEKMESVIFKLQNPDCDTDKAETLRLAKIYAGEEVKVHKPRAGVEIVIGTKKAAGRAATK